MAKNKLFKFLSAIRTFDHLDGPFEKANEAQIGISGINAINVNWPVGEITIKSYDGDSVLIQEFAQRELENTEKLEVGITNGVLHVDYVGEIIKFSMPTKNIHIQVPKQLSNALKELAIESLSATVDLVDVNSQEVELESTSGVINATGMYLKGKINNVSGTINLYNKANNAKIKVKSVSGTTNLTGAFYDVKAKSVSGKINLVNSINANSIMTKTVSGDIKLTLPDTIPPNVYHSAVSGKFSCEVPHTTAETTEQAQISMTTVSGNMKILVNK